MKRAKTHEEIEPLRELCRAGKLFEVQAWIAAGKPVNPLKHRPKGNRRYTPLQLAIAAGFHSLVKVLLDAGAEIEEHDHRYSSLCHALWKDKYDIARLLVEHGADVNSVEMSSVFHTWQSGLIMFFVERGADMETGNPLAQAFCDRVWPALRVYKQFKDRFPSFPEQANIALRYHCRKGDLKWVPLMLWAGADPYAKGPDRPEDEPDPTNDRNALELAAFYGHFDIFGLKAIRCDPKHERARELIRMACYGVNADLLQFLLDRGYPVNDQSNGGSSYITLLLTSMGWESLTKNACLDTPKTREKMKLIHMLAKQRARWIPEDTGQMNQVRKSLLRLEPTYTVELIWVMAKYGACQRPVVSALLRTPTMRDHVSWHWDRAIELMARLPQETG